MTLPVAIAAVFFACVAFVAAEISRLYCARVTPFEDGPATIATPLVVLCVGAAAIGAILTVWKAPPLQIGLAAVVVFSLVSCWCSDALCGIVPDVFSLVPLAAMLLVAIVRHDWQVLGSAAVPFAFFAGAALVTKGKGMGWGDAKLSALTGAALGAPLALLALPIACIAAVVVARVERNKRVPMALAPYIAAFTGIALPLGIVR